VSLPRIEWFVVESPVYQAGDPIVIAIKRGDDLELVLKIGPFLTPTTTVEFDVTHRSRRATRYQIIRTVRSVWMQVLQCAVREAKRVLHQARKEDQCRT
jgi:hypothetical protein